MINSPITNRPNTRLITEFPSKNIIAAYKALNIDIERFVSSYENIRLYECIDTGYRFYYPYTIFGDGKFYEDIENNIAEYYFKDRWEHKIALPRIHAEERVLEVGCGSGYFLERLVENGIAAEGIELNEEAIKKAIQKGLNVKHALLENYVKEKAGYYDVVCAFQVLEHITSVKDFIDDSLTLLKPGGRLMIAVPNNNPYLFRHDKWHTLNLPPHHAGLWNKQVFTEMPKYFNMQVETILIEPLSNYKEWFLVQKNHYKQHNTFMYLLCCLVPRPLYKFVLRTFKHQIQGRNIIAIFKKK
ncbi:class I SAM-dependent methyltransferase [Terrimonas rubra]|uniref:Class I SAM-dependent methyltransferase n=1 Tax=Terrimonas rubra TaxID=1035890 RepID=A0ABW6A6H7_9BACT